MTNQHPITPPPELLDRWNTLPCHLSTKEICVMVARWGADQELEACVNFVYDNELCDPDFYNNLRNARRPKPPTMKEQALAALGWLSIEPCLINGVDVNAAVRAKYDTIRKALEALPND